ncbi:hypothetical protein, partial [Flavihumibacter stibioxidans]
MIKHVMPFVVGLFLCNSLVAQVPKQINYQGIARNVNGTALSNQTIALRLSIREGSSNGTIVYQETRSVSTNQFGLFSTAIGSEGASSVTGNLEGVEWSKAGGKFLQVEIDPKGGTQYVSMGSSPLTSVPFAFRAESANPVGAAGGDLNGNFPNPQIKNGAVNSNKLASGAVTTDKIADGAITADKLAPGIIPTSIPVSGTAGGDLTGAFPNPTVAANAITTTKIADGAITAAKLAPGVIPVSIPVSGTAGGDLSGTYPNPTVAANAVTTAKVADAAITSNKLANASVGSTKVADNAIVANKIAANAVTTAKVADAAITTSKVADGSITAAKLAPGV